MRLGAGTVAVITGAGSGIGRALALDLAARGAALALADLNAGGLETTADLARHGGRQVSTHVLDVADEAAVRDLAGAVERDHGRADLLINNAGVALGGHFDEYELTDLAWIMNVNFWGVVHGCHHFLPLLRREPAAHIVNVSSLFGLIAPAGQTGYCASKFAVRGFSESLRQELAGTPLGLSVVHPGGVRTGIARSARAGRRSTLSAEAAEQGVRDFERHFITSPQDAARTILRGVERGQARILIGPDARLADLIQRLWPGRYNEILARRLG